MASGWTGGWRCLLLPLHPHSQSAPSCALPLEIKVQSVEGAGALTSPPSASITLTLYLHWAQDAQDPGLALDR